MNCTKRWFVLAMIITVVCLCGCSKTEMADITEPTVMEATEPAATAVPAEETAEDVLPWEKGGKQPEEYTWAEYEVLTVPQKEAFFDSFENSGEFDAWLSRVSESEPVSEYEKMPWESGGKQPEEYTWAEYEALTVPQKEAFFDSFESAGAFHEWENRVGENSEDAGTGNMPWEKGGKQPEEYTWAEYKALTAQRKEAFFDSFESVEAFDEWMNRVTASETEKMPWEKGGKQPENYTWAEYEALTALQKETFFDSFESAEAFDKWMNRVTASETEKMPWEKGGKQPKNYTWAEYEVLTALQKEAFFDSFEDVSDFEAWLTANQK